MTRSLAFVAYLEWKFVSLTMITGLSGSWYVEAFITHSITRCLCLHVGATFSVERNLLYFTFMLVLSVR